MKSPIKSAFSGWKIALAIIIGLSISCWMLYRSISQVYFIEVNDGSGTHSWIDGNDNDQLDIHDVTDFKLDDNGNYREQTVSDALGQVNWTLSS